MFAKCSYFIDANAYIGKFEEFETKPKLSFYYNICFIDVKKAE